ncbi:MAG: PFL family protein [Clostridia bacterium]|nr:PFL family protein [Clostridia bacterium]
MLNHGDIIETIKMIDEEHLDVRTITMGISLFDCVDRDVKKFCDRVYEKITRLAGNLVQTGEDIANAYGIPIINKRVSVTPIALVTPGYSVDDMVEVAKTLERAAITCGINFVGGFSALVHKAATQSDLNLIRSLPRALKETSRVCSSINVATTKAGINLDAVKLMGEIIKECAEATAEEDSIGCAKLVVFANVPEDNPFMAGAFHGVGEGECVINVGVSGPGVVSSAIAKHPEANITEIADIVKKTAFKITRMGQMVANEACRRLNVPYGIVDLSLAPTPAVGDSVAHILEEMGLERCGTHGTTACLALLNDAVKKGGTMASSHVGGLSGAFIPVSEDAGMIRAASEGVLTLDKLEAMTAVCSVGLDMIAIPGDTSAATISAIIADEISIGVINNKTTAVRVIPAIGKGVGDTVYFGGLLGEAPIMPVHQESSEKFIHRGGRIPAPIHSLRN